MSKTSRYTEFHNLPNCYSLQFDQESIELSLDPSKPLILELGCGSGKYTNELAKLHSENQYIGVDNKSDRLHFGAKYALENHISNTKRLWASVDHIGRCFSPASVDEIRITFPDPRHGRDRQKLSSPKYQNIYTLLLRPNGLIHIKTDDKAFFDYSLEAFSSGEFTIIKKEEDIYLHKEELQKDSPELFIQTYYESLWLQEGRKVYYLCTKKV